MKIILITPNTAGRYAKPVCPPVGIGYLESFLKKRGHEVSLLDLRVEKENFDYISLIKNINPDIVGVSFMTYRYKDSYFLIDRIKKELGVKIVIGGSHVSTLREKVLEECSADYAVYGEGELTLAQLLENSGLSSVEGLIWRDKDKIIVNPARSPILDLDTLPFPDYEMFALDKYAQKRIPINTARGCPHRCIYCAVDLINGKRFRTRSARNVVDELEYWYKKGYRNFGFNDDTFTENMSRAIEICDEIVRREIKIDWDLRTGIRVDRVNKEVLSKLKLAGCNFIVFGIESVDDEVLRMMRKDITFDLIEKSVRQAKECGLGVGGFFMIGTPLDSYQKFRKTYDFASRDYFDEVRFYNTVPYPKTEMFEWIKQNGKFMLASDEYLNSCERWQEEPIFETSTFPLKDRVKAFNEGEFLVAKKLIIKVLGKKAGLFLCVPCKLKLIRKFVMNMGFSMASWVLKILELKVRKQNEKVPYCN
jgi:radical SAM superfamily enzyme YgiQ (UPF0313 family)